MDKLKINSGEYIAMNVLKIISIPHLTILTDNTSVAEQTHVIVSYAQNMAAMLTEIYQQYKDLYARGAGTNPDMSMELTWVTEPVQNQPYKANISLYIVLRAINHDPLFAEQTVNSIMALIISTLEADKYEYEKSSATQYLLSLEKSNRGSVKAIVKEERMEDLQNQYFPVCYAYDLFPVDYQDLSRITGVLIANPHCAVSFQLIPTYYTQDELTELNRVSQSMSMLSHGVSDREVGNVSISAADRVPVLYKYYSENNSSLKFQYSAKQSFAANTRVL